jgi:hypothetical protein
MEQQNTEEYNVYLGYASFLYYIREPLKLKFLEIPII